MRPEPPEPPAAPRTGLRARMQQWWWERLPRSDSHELVQRNLYILPTRAGLLLGATLLALLLASINYQLNLGYVLTFLLAGCAAASVPMTYRTLHALRMHIVAPAPQFAHSPVLLCVQLHNTRAGTRHGLAVALARPPGQARRRPVRQQQASVFAAPCDGAVWLDCPPQSRTQVQLAWSAPRGWHDLPAIALHTRFPLGLFRLWSIWRPQSRCLIYPAPERDAPPMPHHGAWDGDEDDAHSAPNAMPATHAAMPDELRPYQRGDAMRLIAWKKAAQTGELVTRQSQRAHASVLWLHYAQAAAPGLAPEAVLSRLCAWVLEGEQGQWSFGLSLPATAGASALRLPPDAGPQHVQRCLRALAEHGLPRRQQAPAP